MAVNLDQRGRRDTLLRFAPVLLWIFVILFLGSDQGSMNQTSRFIGPLLHWLLPNAPEETILLYHFYIRKAAHLTEYGILSLLTWRLVAGSASAAWRRYRYLLPVLLVAAVASIDEYNQSFEPSRTSSPYDVLLDVSGAVGALVLLTLVMSLLARRRQQSGAPKQA